VWARPRTVALTRILGIDPGSRLTGYGVIDSDGRRSVHVASGAIRSIEGALAERLRRVFDGIGAVIAAHEPAEVAVERVFVSRNAESALKLGQARGAALVAAASHGLPVFEFTPAQIKQAIVGRGGAGKVQVQHMVRVLLGLRETPAADAADALAAAICHAHTRGGVAAMAPVRAARGGRLL